ncbi:MAG: hypothetical protein WCS03_00810 [Bacteroidota bacterium]
MTIKPVYSLSFTLFAWAMFSCGRSPHIQPPLSLHPQNPHYFLFREKPAILIGSTEHYGAVMNLDFDYIKYLNEIAASGLNVTRTFSGVYVEPAGTFGNYLRCSLEIMSIMSVTLRITRKYCHSDILKLLKFRKKWSGK